MFECTVRPISMKKEIGEEITSFSAEMLNDIYTKNVKTNISRKLIYLRN